MLPDFKKMFFKHGEGPSPDIYEKYAPFIPKLARKEWRLVNEEFYKHYEFVKNKDWKIYSKGKNDKMYTRVENNQYFCAKSVSYCREDYEKIVMALCDHDLKAKYDETFENGYYCPPNLPLESSIQYMKYKKVLVVSPRDLVLVGSIRRINEKECWLFAKTFEYPPIPHVKNVVRAETLISGWRVQQKDDGNPATGEKPLLKLTFYAMPDFKLSLFIQKSVGPKSSHLAIAFTDYIQKHPLP